MTVRQNHFYIRSLAREIDERAGDLVEAAGLDEAMDPEAYEEARTLVEDLSAEFEGSLAGAELVLHLGMARKHSIPEMQIIYLEAGECVFRICDNNGRGTWVRANLATAAEEAAEWRAAVRTGDGELMPWRIR